MCLGYLIFFGLFWLKNKLGKCTVIARKKCGIKKLYQAIQAWGGGPQPKRKEQNLSNFKLTNYD